MQNVRVLCVGSLKEKYLRDGCAEYLKRLTAYCRPEVIEIPEVRPVAQTGPAISAAMEKEGKKLLSLMEGGYNIALCIEGDMLDSPGLARMMSSLAMEGGSKVNFIIGSSCGLSNEVKLSADMCLSFSRMTFPHQLMRMILLEQIYRAYTIIAVTSYHK